LNLFFCLLPAANRLLPTDYEIEPEAWSPLRRRRSCAFADYFGASLLKRILLLSQ
jgi:hypothetical protein